MAACSVCGGRTISAPEGVKCMNPRCAGASLEAGAAQETVQCRCGESMQYTGLNAWGEPKYHCVACGATTKL